MKNCEGHFGLITTQGKKMQRICITDIKMKNTAVQKHTGIQYTVHQGPLNTSKRNALQKFCQILMYN